jgi:hypothetical protein
MELLESHFNTLSGNLTYDEKTDTYEMFSNKLGIKKHLNYLTFKKLFDLSPLPIGICESGNVKTIIK